MTATATTEPLSPAKPADSSDRCIAVRQANGTLSILNYRFGQDPKRRLLSAEAAGSRLLAVAGSLVAATEESCYRVVAARRAAWCRHPMATALVNDMKDARERLWMAGDVFVHELDMRDSFGVVVVKGHACYRNPADGRKADCVRLDGKAPCAECHGSGVQHGVGSPVPCDLCSGSGVSPDPAWLPGCLAAMLESGTVNALSWLEVPAPAMKPVDPAFQRLANDFEPFAF